MLVDFEEGRCNFVALINTGSSVSFIKYSVYLSNCKYFAHKLRPTNRKFVNIKDSLLEMVGTIEVKLLLSLLKDRKFAVTLFVIKDHAFTNIILGRDFIIAQNLTVIFKFRENNGEEKYNKLGLFAELSLHVDDEPLTKLERQLQQSEIDFDFERKQQLNES